MRTRGVLVSLLALAAGCGSDLSIPQYMQDLPRSEEESLRMLAEIRRELGPDTRVEQVEDFFFVASNDTETMFHQCKATVARIFGYLHTDYFTKKPEKPIRVYLFKDRQTYEGYCASTYQKPPSTPFGFYMSSERKMVMNISTGTGTLAHELVHPLLSEDFPEVPSWFNEGFASLFEQSGPRDGKMVGFVNWRLPGLHKALKMNRAVSLKELLGFSAAQFYGEERGVNYATARYLCMYLQEKNLLIPFYRQFKAMHSEEPTGAAALEKVTRMKLGDLEADWRRWVLTLRYGD